MRDRREAETTERHETALQAVTDAQVRSRGFRASDAATLLPPATLKLSRCHNPLKRSFCTFQAAIEEGDPDRALKYALSSVNALAGDEKGAAEVAGAVREQIVVAVRRLTSAAKEAGRAEQVSSPDIPTHSHVHRRFVGTYRRQSVLAQPSLETLLLIRPRRWMISSSFLPNRRRKRSS